MAWKNSHKNWSAAKARPTASTGLPGQGSGDSPAGDFVNQAELEDASKGEGYFGYRFRILTGQGDRVAGGAYDYLINSNMIAGFGLDRLAGQIC